MSKMQSDVGWGAIDSSINSPLCQKFSLKLKNKHKNSKKAFSVAEAMIALLIGSLALGMAAPMITKQIKAQNMTDTQFRVINRQADELRDLVNDLMEEIEDLRNNNNDNNGVEDGAVMFYATTSCPENWAKITGFGGYYLRIQKAGETIGSIKEQMVHRHKHVSPFLSHNSNAMSNTHRYGPYAPNNADVGALGDGSYTAAPSSTHILSGGDYSAAVYNKWFLYTSDGMNRSETLSRTRSKLYSVLTCPNRDEGDSICKKSGNQYNIPYLSNMPLVGNENRPNSLVLTACVKGYKTCSMVNNKLNCTK